MIKFTALNEVSGFRDGGSNVCPLLTKEAQEEEAYSIYNKALEAQKVGNNELATELFEEVLDLDFVAEAIPKEGEEGPLTPALTLKYLSNKNLAAISTQQNNFNAAMKSYLEAVSVDSSDVTIWYKMGKVALKLHNYPLARICFEEGLKCNQNHWPCLDNVITILYAVGDYANCLYFISRALSRESSFLKGLIFRDQIYKEHPGLKSYCDDFFKDCDSSIRTAVYDAEDAQKFIQESLAMREKKHELSRTPPLPVLCLKQGIKDFTWKVLGESFISLYDHISNSDPPLSFGCRVDLTKCCETSDKPQESVTDSEKRVSSPTTVSSSSEAYSAPAASPASLNTPVAQPSQTPVLPVQHHQVQQYDEQQQQYQPSTTECQVETEISTTPLISNVPTVFVSTIPTAQIKLIDGDIYLDSSVVGRRGKRKRLFLENADFGAKRRSTRVRNTATTVKKPQDNINYQELLTKFLPSSLMGDKNDDQDHDKEIGTHLQHNGDHTYGQAAVSVNAEECTATTENSFSAAEKNDVKQFLLNNQSNGGILDLLHKYLIDLSYKGNLLWPKGLVDIFLACYSRYRNHFTLPSLFCQDLDNEIIRDHGILTLIYCELKMDKWHIAKGHTATTSLSPSLSSKGNGPQSPENKLVIEFPGKHFYCNLDYLLHLLTRRDILEKDWLNFVIRVFWLKARCHVLEGDMDSAVNYLDQISASLLQQEEKLDPSNKKPICINLINCTVYNVITFDHIEEQLESLQRCQSLDEVHRLCDQGNYQSVVDLLVLTFRQPKTRSKASPARGIPERHDQLLLLQDSLLKLENYKKCMKWSEISFNEALHHYSNANTISSRSEWADTMTRLLYGIEKCLKNDKANIDALEDQKRARLSNNLIQTISLFMENSESPYEVAVPTVLCWMMLYWLILCEDTKIHKLAQKSSAMAAEKNNSDKEAPLIKESISSEEINLNKGSISLDKLPSVPASPSTPFSPPNVQQPSSEIDFGVGMPSSLMLLFTAHECLGRLSLCTAYNGALLILCVEIMMKELKKCSSYSHPFREDLEGGLEQCFYCMYGHPNKRTKAKHLQEHNARQISLIWENVSPIFYYFKPTTLPEFDSYRTSTVSAELENLLRRISALVPKDQDFTGRSDAIVAYIEGGTEKCPSLETDEPPPSGIVLDLYYLLADYYFKSKEFGKAIKYYIFDICINNDRLDSWAGMALARSSQLEQKLNSCELKNEAAIYKRSSSALKCFQHALMLDSANSSLWIEYGSLSFMLHSHASRHLKQQGQFGFGEDMIELLRNKREEMLSAAKNCFQSANRCGSDQGTEPEEVWLHHYMLGKTAEKQKDNPEVYVKHYCLAAKYLHEDEARYPKKIQYHNPPDFSIESLEVYYRIHASTLKFLSNYENQSLPQDQINTLHKHLKETAEGPFANFQEKNERERYWSILNKKWREGFQSVYIRYASMSSSEADESSSLLQVSKKKPKKVVSATSDHNYYHGQVNPISTEVKSPIVSERSHRHSVDSCTESLDSVAVKEVLNSIVSVVSECNSDSQDGKDNLTDTSNDVKNAKTLMQLDESALSPEKFVLNTIEVETLDVALPSSIPSYQEEMLDISVTKNTPTESEENVQAMEIETGEHSVDTDGVNNNSQSEISDIIPTENTPSEEKDADQDTTEKPTNDSTEKSPLQDENLEMQSEEHEEAVTEDKLDSSSKDNIKSDVTSDELIQTCITAMLECLQRFPQHYKSPYRLAHYYCYSPKNKNLSWAREILLGTIPPWPSTCAPCPGLFSERKNTNFFNGIWRVPNNEIDRPGSFGAHMHRSVVLLLEVLLQLEDHSMLLHLTLQLHRVPDLGKKYLRDIDRAHLARKAFNYCLQILRDQLNNLCLEEPPPEEWRLINCLLDIYRAWQTLQKSGIFPEDTNELLKDAYKVYKLGEVDPSPSVLEQATRFCQMHSAKSNQYNPDGSRNLSYVPSTSKQAASTDIQCDERSNAAPTNSNVTNSAGYSLDLGLKGK